MSNIVNIFNTSVFESVSCCRGFRSNVFFRINEYVKYFVTKLNSSSNVRQIAFKKIVIASLNFFLRFLELIIRSFPFSKQIRIYYGENATF